MAIPVDLKPDRECKKWIRLAWRIGSWRWRVYGWRWLKGLPKSKGSYIYTNSNHYTADITLAVGCIQDLTHHELIEQTIHFLNRLDIQVALEKRQPCCGAIFERLAHFEQTKEYQNKRKSQFNHWMPTPVCFLSQNCQQFISRDSANHGRMIDLYRLIMQKLEEKNIRLALKTPVEVYYQPYCAQKGVDFAWTLLNQIGGLKIKTLWPVKSCCGGCGGEALLNPQHASELRESKFKHLPNDAVMVVSSFDCWMQCKQTMQVLYPIQLLVNSEMK